MSDSSTMAASPFLDIPSFTPAAPRPAPADEAPAPPSPFRAVYRSEDTAESTDPRTAEVIEFLFEMHDPDFDEALIEVADEVRDLLGRQETGSPVIQDRMLDNFLEPVAAEMERLTARLAETADARGTAFTVSEIEEAIDGYATEEALAPAFEHLFGGWKKKLKKLAKKGLKLAKKGVAAAARLGFGPILKKLKGHLGKLLKWALRKVIGKLPAYLRPVARKLAKRYGGRFLSEAELEDAEADDAVTDPAEAQRGFDEYLTFYVFADQEHDQDALMAELEGEASGLATDPIAELQAARERFVDEISGIEGDADPEVAVQNFVPAILPVLKAGVKLVGRKRIVSELSKHLAKLVRKFVGKRYARPLSQAVVDLGLRYSGLEVAEDAVPDVAAEAVAYSVEETVRRLAALPEAALENEAALEAEVVRAFEATAAAHLPDVLPEETYEVRPDLRESCTRPGFWVGMPLNARRKLYRKLAGGADEVSVCPHSLARVRTWRGQSLASHMRNRLGTNTGRRLTARLRLFEVMAGGSLHDIAHSEPDLQIVGRAPSWRLLHPLTREAAGLLLGEPGLGRDMPARYLDTPARAPAVGQRFYFLQLPEALPQIFAATGRPAVLRRPSELRLSLDLIREALSVDIALSEARAQGLAADLRAGAGAATLGGALRPVIAEGIAAALRNGMHHRVRILHPDLPPEVADGRALGLLPAAVVQKFATRLCEWVERGLAEKTDGAAVVAAADADADGITLRIAFSAAPGLRKMRAALAGEAVRLREPWFSSGAPHATVHALAGAG